MLERLDDRVTLALVSNKKNTPLPCESSQTFYTLSEGQTDLEVTITQGEDKDIEYVNKIATHKFKLPPNRPADRPIKVTYSYDANQRMHCKFEDVESGKVLEVDLCLNQEGVMTESDVKGKNKKVKSFKVE